MAGGGGGGVEVHGFRTCPQLLNFFLHFSANFRQLPQFSAILLQYFSLAHLTCLLMPDAVSGEPYKCAQLCTTMRLHFVHACKPLNGSVLGSFLNARNLSHMSHMLDHSPLLGMSDVPHFCLQGEYGT